jgi:hypothetical protein
MNVEVLVQALDMLAFFLVTPEFLGEERLKEARGALENMISNIKADEHVVAHEIGKELYSMGKEIFMKEKKKTLVEFIDQIILTVRRAVIWVTTYKSTNIKGIILEIFAKCKALLVSWQDITGFIGDIAEPLFEVVATYLVLILIWLARPFAIRGTTVRHRLLFIFLGSCGSHLVGSLMRNNTSMR